MVSVIDIVGAERCPHYTREGCVSEKETCSNVRLHGETSVSGHRKEKSQCISGAC